LCVLTPAWCEFTRSLRTSLRRSLARARSRARSLGARASPRLVLAASRTEGCRDPPGAEPGGCHFALSPRRPGLAVGHTSHFARPRPAGQLEPGRPLCARAAVRRTSCGSTCGTRSPGEHRPVFAYKNDVTFSEGSDVQLKPNVITYSWDGMGGGLAGGGLASPS
jgi:hypothetical protein